MVFMSGNLHNLSVQAAASLMSARCASPFMSDKCYHCCCCRCCYLLLLCREQHQNSSVVLELLSKKTAKEQARLDQYRSHGAAVQAQCEHMTKEACMAANNAPRACHKMHKRCAAVCLLRMQRAYGRCFSALHAALCKRLMKRLGLPLKQSGRCSWACLQPSSTMRQ
jgi:hypothetical protein